MYLVRFYSLSILQIIKQYDAEMASDSFHSFYAIWTKISFTSKSETFKPPKLDQIILGSLNENL